MKTRPSAVAGTFYPDNPELLSKQLAALLEQSNHSLSYAPKALIVPHAGLIYSGRVAAAAYHHLAAFSDQYSRVILLGPAHRVGFYGLAWSSMAAFQTPLGNVRLETALPAQLAKFPQAFVYDAAHAEEHSLEVQLPFLQVCLPKFELIPVVVGESSPSEVAEVLSALWGGPETLILASSDLSHFLPYEKARSVDSQTSKKIMNLQTDLSSREACGCRVLNGFLTVAGDKKMSIDLLALENSGDTAGNRARVVGYGAYALH